MPDLIRIAKAVTVGACLIASGLFFFNRLEGVPRSVIPLYVFLLLLLLCIPRFIYRFWKERTLVDHTGRRGLIVGAGSAGEMLVRDLLGNRQADVVPVVFVDDAREKFRREIRGIRVAGTVEQIPQVVKQWEVETILIAIPSANDAQMRRIVEICESCSVPFQTLPSVKELLSGRVTKDSLRDVSIEDVLGRDPVKLEWRPIRQSLQEKVIMVTGGGGSIGSELCKQLARVRPAKLVVFDHCEFNLYKIDAELTKMFPELDYEVVLGNASIEPIVQYVIERHRPDVIFHAAAYKHVPLLENQAR